MPGLTAEQTASLQVMITTAIHDAVTQAISQAMTAFETRQQQSIVEKTAEKTAEKTTENKSTGSSSDNDNTGTLSTIPHQATMHYCRESSLGQPISTRGSTSQFRIFENRKIAKSQNRKIIFYSYRLNNILIY